MSVYEYSVSVDVYSTSVYNHSVSVCNYFSSVDEYSTSVYNHSTSVYESSALVYECYPTVGDSCGFEGDCSGVYGDGWLRFFVSLGALAPANGFLADARARDRWQCFILLRKKTPKRMVWGRGTLLNPIRRKRGLHGGVPPLSPHTMRVLTK